MKEHVQNPLYQAFYSDNINYEPTDSQSQAQERK